MTLRHSCSHGPASAVLIRHTPPCSCSPTVGYPAPRSPHQMPTCPTRHAARALCPQVALRPRPPLLPGLHGRQRPALDVHPRQVSAGAHGGGAARAEQHDRVRLRLRERDGVDFAACHDAWSHSTAPHTQMVVIVFSHGARRQGCAAHHLLGTCTSTSTTPILHSNSCTTSAPLKCQFTLQPHCCVS